MVEPGSALGVVETITVTGISFLGEFKPLQEFGRYDERILRVTMPIAGCNSRLRKRYAAAK